MTKTEPKKIRVLFVCLGNICRSPTAEGVFAQRVADAGLAEQIEIDSAGTHAYHIGNPPDPRTREVAAARGIDLSHLRARQVAKGDFAAFDYLIAMDRDNLDHLRASCPKAHLDRLHLLTDFAPNEPEDEVPDPYYGGPSGFERVFDLVTVAADGLLRHIRATHGL